MAVEHCPEFLRAVFQSVFPHFYDQPKWSWDDRPEVKKSFESIPRLVLSQPTVLRRFGAYVLPRRRYYTVCADSLGNDYGTLRNELRAYRDPVRTGMVDVLDFGLGETVLLVGDREIEFDRSSDLGVVLDNPKLLAELLEHAPHEVVESSDGKVVALVKFPYRIDRVEFPRALDLRAPTARAWFAEQFSKPNDDWIWPQRIREMSGLSEVPDPPQTILSMYERSDGQAPVPRNFVEMLPTLLNQLRGGGDQPWGGTTLMAIGEWLRNRDVDALIYPASRSDAFVIYEKGELRDFGGWCLVDYRRHEGDMYGHFVQFDQNPWSWVALPPGVTVAVGEDEFAGTLLIRGIAEYGRDEYLHQVEALRAAEEAIGPASPSITPREAFALGTFMLRWLYLAFVSADQAHITVAYLVSCGLTLRNDREYLAGKIRWVYKRLAVDGDADPALKDLVEIASEFESRLAEPGVVRDICDIYSAAVDLQLVLLILTRAALAGRTTVQSELSAPGLRKLQLPPELKAQADAFLRAIEVPESTISTSAGSAVELSCSLATHYGLRLAPVRHASQPDAF
jgi:hypothetical protein